MKRLFICLILSAFASLAWAQSLINEIHLNNGSIIKGYILELTPSNSVKIQTYDGSIFVYPMSEVDFISQSERKFRGSPYAGTIRVIDRHKGYFYWVDTGDALTKEDYSFVFDDDLYKTFQSAHKQFASGRTFIAVGLMSLCAATMTYWANLEENSPELQNMFYWTAGLGEVNICIGCILKGVGKGRLEWVKDTYNSGHRFQSSNLSLSPSLVMTAQNDMGFGMSLNLSF